ncbi:MAG: FmdB family zinc ribbon protein [Pirellula sp.]
MPIYEYYCSACHTLYSFLARRMNPPTPPACPKCSRNPLEKKVSRFAISKGLTERAAGEDPFDHVDEAKMDRLMEHMAPQLDEAGQEDPRQVAAMMKKMFELAGAEPNGAMLEAMKRMEAGADPDQIDEELGAALDAEGDPFVKSGEKPLSRLRRRMAPPNVDPELYEM